MIADNNKKKKRPRVVGTLEEPPLVDILTTEHFVRFI